MVLQLFMKQVTKSMRSNKSSPLNASKGIQCLYSSPFFCLDRVEYKVSCEITLISCIRTLTLRSYSISHQPTWLKGLSVPQGFKNVCICLRVQSQ